MNIYRDRAQRLIDKKFDYVHVSDSFVNQVIHRAVTADAWPPIAAWSPELPEERLQELREEAEQVRAQAKEDARVAIRKELEDLLGEAFERGVELSTDREASRAAQIRGGALLLVVLAIILMPIIAMLTGLDPETFGSFIAPITGIAGTVVGFWFSSRGTGQGE